MNFLLGFGGGNKPTTLSFCIYRYILNIKNKKNKKPCPPCPNVAPPAR